MKLRELKTEVKRKPCQAPRCERHQSLFQLPSVNWFNVCEIFICILFALGTIVAIGCGTNDGKENSIWKVPPSDVPICVKEIIERERSYPNVTSPIYVSRYKYDSKTVYYLFSVCCDHLNNVVDEQCVVICAPNGGRSGAGDGKCPDFFIDATERQIIWCEDEDTCDCLEDPFC